MTNPFSKVMGKKVMCLYPWKSDEEVKTNGGIIIPGEQKDKPNNLEVTLSSVEGINPGDRVVFNRYHGTTIEINKQEYLFLKEEEILGVISKEYTDIADRNNQRFSGAP